MNSRTHKAPTCHPQHMGKNSPILHLLLFLILCGSAHSRLLVQQQQPSITAAKICKERYGFMPCSSSAPGNVFLILMYGYFLFLAAQYRSNGSDLLVKIWGLGSIVAGLILPILVALPDSMLILVSGLSGSKATAQSQVSIEMGLLSGSTVMLLTVIWGSCILVGKSDLEQGVAAKVKDTNGKDTKGLGLTSSGITTDIWTCYTARVMAISIIPFLVVQLPQVIHPTYGRNLRVLISLIVSVSLFVSYCLYQIFQPRIQRRRIAHATLKHVVSEVLLHLKKLSLGRFLTDDGEPNREVVEKLFNKIDVNEDGCLSASEVKAFLIGIRFDNELIFDMDAAAAKLMKDFDTSEDSLVDKEEFFYGISKWVKKARQCGDDQPKDSDHGKLKFLEKFRKQAKLEHALSGARHQRNELFDSVDNPKWTSFKAVLMLLMGTTVAAAFADPLVDAVENFSNATNIPSFLIAFIVLPWATSSGEAVSAIVFAGRKELGTTSKTLSELYGMVTRNNVLSQSVFFALVYVRGLTWDFSGEVLAILVVCVLMGTFASFRTSFPAWTSPLAFLLYSLSLLIFMLLNMFTVTHKS